MDNILNSNRQSDLIKNIFDTMTGKIKKGNYKNKHNFFKKRATNCYIQEQDITLCKCCGNGEIENKIHFFFECRNYALRNDTFKRIKEI